MKKTLIAFTVFATCVGLFSSCSEGTENIPATKPNTFKAGLKKIEPEKIVIEYHEGHSHLPLDEDDPKNDSKNDAGDLGDVFWSRSGQNSGFHANPDSRVAKFPHHTIQFMELFRQADGSYQISSEGTDAIRMITSLGKGGKWHAFIVQLFDKEGNRMDLDLRKPEMQDRVQVFWHVSDIHPLYNGAPAKKNIRPEEAFFFMYFDREKDNSSKVLRNPLGFRGVVKAQEPYVKYNVTLTLTILPEGKSKGSLQNSVSPTQEQLGAMALQITFPCRNITYGLSDRLPSDATEKDWEADDQRYYADLSKEYSAYTPKQIEELQTTLDLLPIEGAGGSQFWL